MATAPTESLPETLPETLYASLTADMIRRPSEAEFAATLRRVPRLRRPIFSENVRLFATTWAGGFVFFFTFLG
ncbi:hypothetical protein HFP51_06830 [Parasphingopyxis sp. CP4]|uniref:hypothetical protein n=1 Tax=Parasphingopyxis sp. CP4 TaxID=2724527 RepID=UPI00159F85EF|nr:hypothetical protein [Parasphingopyxis sp. CP4]QLC21923.1 hypothetical protein HFP51_06830 [Parasphingopyxis sp. CP4]